MAVRRHHSPADAAEQTRYLIVGGGLAADAACRGIREHDPDGDILLLSDEVHPPYARPPLSKGLWKGDKEETVWRLTANLGVHEHLGRRVAQIDPDARRARDDRGDEYAYERLLLATGGKPRRLPFGGEEVIYFRTLTDYHRLRRLAETRERFLVIGGGFIGSEIAAALALVNRHVTMVFPETGIGARVFPPALSAALNDYYRNRDVTVLPEETVTALERRGETVQVILESGRMLEADAVVAGIGIEPNSELAAAAGLPVANGIVVDAYGRIGGRDDLFAAGDVARFPASALGIELRVEHEDHAKSHGRLVGANMAGARERYDHLPFFYSDLFDVGYEAVGELDARLDTLLDWSEPEGEGTITYLDGDRRPRGALLWNRFGHLDAARALIRAGEPVGQHVQVG